MKIYSTIFILLSFECLGQFRIIVDPTYEKKIKTAIYLIYTTNTSDYVRLTSECSQIRITSDSIPNQYEDEIIRIPLKIVSESSYNNLASWLVYQSYYLSLKNRKSLLSPQIKDSLSTKYEFEFSKLLLPESRKSIRTLRKSSEVFWSYNPYENTEKQSDSIKTNLGIKILNYLKK